MIQFKTGTMKSKWMFFQFGEGRVTFWNQYTNQEFKRDGYNWENAMSLIKYLNHR